MFQESAYTRTSLFFQFSFDILSESIFRFLITRVNIPYLRLHDFQSACKLCPRFSTAFFHSQLSSECDTGLGPSWTALTCICILVGLEVRGLGSELRLHKYYGAGSVDEGMQI